MHCSREQLAANRKNTLISQEPLLNEGKLKSSFKSFKHKLIRQGIVLEAEDQGEVEARFEEFEADLKPRNGIERYFVRRATLLSERLDLSVRQEMAMTSERMRKGEADLTTPGLPRSNGSLARSPSRLGQPL